MTRLDLPDLAKARKHLADAEDAFDHGEHDEAAALAAIGTGYAQLAAAETITAKPEPIGIHAAAGAAPEAVAAWIRAAQASDEARPHHGEPAAEHADDCAGCDGPGVVPCAADEVRNGLAYRDGFPIKDLQVDANPSSGVTRPEAGRG